MAGPTEAERDAGPAHVAAASFLASRVAPAGGFWIALAGGLALARVAQRRGPREGYGASAAAMLETVAIMGPARFGIPLTQAVTAPLLGRLEAHGWGTRAQVVVCTAIRLAQNTLTTVLFVWLIAGGLDTYAKTYDNLAGRVGLSVSNGLVVALTVAGLVFWAVFASTMQVMVYRRGLRDWESVPAVDPGSVPPTRVPSRAPRFDPRAVTLAAAAVFAALLATTAWPLLGAVAVWLALAWATARADSQPVRTGLALAGLLGVGALVFGLGGGLGADETVRRALRAVLLVLTATWLRAAAGAEGVREVARRALGRIGWMPAAPETVRALDAIGGEGRMPAAGRSLIAALSGVRHRPVPVLDAVLGWVAAEAARFRPLPPAERPRLRLGAVDVLLVAGLVVVAAALVFA